MTIDNCADLSFWVEASRNTEDKIESVTSQWILLNIDLYSLSIYKETLRRRRGLVLENFMYWIYGV